MGYNARNDEIRDNITRMRREWETQRDALATVKPRDPEASIRVALADVQCPRCNGYGRPRIIALARQPSV